MQSEDAALRVLLVEDHKVVRQGTRLFLETMGLNIIGEATTGTEAIQLARTLQPHIIVMDINLPELTGIEATRRIRGENKEVRILILTAYDDPAYIHALVESGADGYILKTADLAQLYDAIQNVAAGQQAFDARTLNRARQFDEAQPVEYLTNREIDILRQARHGLTNKQIGRLLHISDRTVQGHLQNIYQKLNVSSRTEAVTRALQLGLIPLDEEGYD
ncbi:MAG: response regulator [Chloroflexota bacterium]